MRGSLLINTIVTFMPFFNKLTVSAKNAKTILDDLDIAGFNYANGMMEDLHQLRPDVILLNTETYPKSIGENWPVVAKNNSIIGDFMWTAWDYLGKTGVGLVEYNKKRGSFTKPYPCVSAGCGAIDMTGYVEAQGVYASTVWGYQNQPYIGVRPVNHSGENYFMGQWRGTDAINSWSWDGCEGKKAEIEVYSQEATVELQINGQSIGRKPLTQCKASFAVDYHPGEIRAIAYNLEGKRVSESSLTSAETDKAITIVPEYGSIVADGEDSSYIDIEITDNNGVCKVLSDQRIHVEVTGAGTLAGIGSGNPETTNDFTGNDYMTYYGRAMAVIRSTGQKGKIQIQVSSDAMTTKRIEIMAV